MQVSLTLTFGPDEGAIFEVAVAKIASLGSVLKSLAAPLTTAQDPAHPMTSVPPARNAAATEIAKHPDAPPSVVALDAALNAAQSAPEALASSPVTDDPFAPAAPSADTKSKRGRRSSRPTTQNILAGGPVEEKKVEAPAKDQPTVKEVSVEQLQKMSTEIIVKQPNDKKKVMDIVYTYKNVHGANAVSWKDLTAEQRVDALKKLQNIYLGDKIPF